MFRIVLVAVFAMLFASNSLAQKSAAQPEPIFQSGKKLYQICQNKEAFPDGFCLGYVVGIADALTGPSKGYRGRTFCIPVGSIQNQIEFAVKKWLESNPDKRHLNAPDLVAWALSEAFPCRR